MRRKTPVVQIRILVALDACVSCLTLNPTSVPIAVLRSSAMRKAADRAAIRLGCKTTICPGRPPFRVASPASRMAGGTRVVLPAPGSALRTIERVEDKVATISGNISSIGNRFIEGVLTSDPVRVKELALVAGWQRQLYCSIGAKAPWPAVTIERAAAIFRSRSLIWRSALSLLATMRLSTSLFCMTEITESSQVVML